MKSNSCPRPKKLRSEKSKLPLILEYAPVIVELQVSKTRTETSTESVQFAIAIGFITTLPTNLWPLIKRSDSLIINGSSSWFCLKSKKFLMVQFFDFKC